MLRTVLWIGLACVMGLGVTIAHAQAPDAQAGEPTQDHLDQIENIRAGIVDPQARPEDRRRWSELLLSYSSPQARTLVVELLGLAESPDVQRALCGVIADRARQAPQLLDATLVEPLTELLGAETGHLRAMAANALADFPDADVPARLGALAAQVDAPLVKRLAAIDALAPNTHRREVVRQLISLLDAEAPEITEQVASALESATPQTFGLDCERWRRWWKQKSQLSEEAWLAEQLRIYRDRSRGVADEFQTFREDARRDQTAVIARTSSFQRELFRALSGDQRMAKLAEWLDDTLPVVKLTALSIIKAQIADEGKRPEGHVLVALLRLLQDGSPKMRREVLDILQNLNDPAVVEAVLAQLEREDNPPTRHAIFKALGKQDSPEAIPALIREIADPESLSTCVREAAIALGRIAGKTSDAEAMQDAIGALKSRYQSAPNEDQAMRAAMLTAMAGVADDAFIPELLQALESDDAAILQPAIRGVLAVNDTSKLPRLRALTAHADPRVRLAAIEAVGQLGREEADLESLLTRLNPTIETNELAREAAWRGFRTLLGNRSVGDRFEAAQRLRDLPDLEIEYLEELADALSGVNGDPDDQEAVLDRLAAVLVNEGRYDEAIGHLEALYDRQVTRSDPGATACGLRLLNTMLRSSAVSEAADLVQQLAASAGDNAARARIIETVGDYLQSPDMTGNPQRARRLLDDLRSVSTEVLGDAWIQLLETADRRLDPDDTDPAPSPPPPGD